MGNRAESYPSANIFVGRGEELDLLVTHARTAFAGEGRIALVTGDAGIGKTRLVGRLIERVRQPSLRVAWGRCWEEPGTPAFWPWRQVFTTVAETAAAGGEHRAVDVLLEGREHPSASEESGSAADRFALLVEMTEKLRRWAAATPMVIVLEDIHFGDPASLLMTRFLADRLSDAAILLVLTYRPEERPPADPVEHTIPALEQLACTLRLRLRGFDAAEVRDYVRAAGGPVLSAADADVLRDRTSGNPLHLREWVELLRSEGHLDRGAKLPSALRVPPTIRGLLERRFNRVSPECREALSYASVIGRRFRLSMLAQLSGLSVEHVLDRLDEAARWGLVRPEDFESGEHWEFSHVSFRDVLYEAVRPARRARLHLDIAVAIEAASDGEYDVDDIAVHCARGIPLTPDPMVLRYATAAGERALRSFAFEQAADHFRAALLAARAAPVSVRVELMLQLGDCLRRSGEMDAAKGIRMQAVELSRSASDPELLARAALALGDPWSSLGVEVPELIAALEEAHRALPRRASPLRARVLAGLANALGQGSQWSDRTRAYAAQGRTMARRVGDKRAELEALSVERECEAEPRRRLRMADRILTLASVLTDREAVLRARLWRRVDLIELGDMVAADAELELMEVMARVSGEARHRWWVLLAQAMREILRGSFEAAGPRIQAAWDAGREGAGGTVADEFAWMQMFVVYRAQGRLAELEPAVLDAARRYPTYFSARSALAALYTELGRADEARAQLMEVIADESFDPPASEFRISGLAVLAETCAFVQDRRRASILYRLLEPYASSAVVVGIGVVCEGAVSRYLGMLAATLGRWSDASRHFEHAVRFDRRIGSKPLVAASRLAYAKALSSSPSSADTEPIAKLCDRARAAFLDFGMSAHAARADAILQRIRSAGCGGDAGQGRDGNEDDLLLRGWFQRQNEVWVVGLGDRRAQVRDRKGLRYIGALLRCPETYLSALELVRGPAEEAALAGADLGDAGVLSDVEARRQYRTRIARLGEEIARAQAAGDEATATQARAEREQIEDHLSSVYGRGGRARRAGSASERARVNARNSITSALGLIERHDAALGRHLANSIRTGTFCIYRPERPINWTL